MNIKLVLLKSNKIYFNKIKSLSKIVNHKLLLSGSLITNLIPHVAFNKTLNKKVLDSFTNKNFDEPITPWYYHTLIRFIENCSGQKVIFQFYPFISQTIKIEDTARYKK